MNAAFSICTVHKSTFRQNTCLHPTDGWMWLSDFDWRRAFINWLPSLSIPTGPNVLRQAVTSKKKSVQLLSEHTLYMFRIYLSPRRIPYFMNIPNEIVVSLNNCRIFIAYSTNGWIWKWLLPLSLFQEKKLIFFLAKK